LTVECQYLKRAPEKSTSAAETKKYLKKKIRHALLQIKYKIILNNDIAANL